MSQWNNPKVRLCNARKNYNKPQEFHFSHFRQVSTSLKVHDSTIRNRLNKYWLILRVARRKPHLAIMKMSAHLNTPHDVWNNILWTDKTKMEMFSYKIHHHTGENQRHHISTSYQLWWRGDHWCGRHRSWTTCNWLFWFKSVYNKQISALWHF